MLNPELGIYRLRLPLPFRLNHVNAYIIHGRAGWWIIDTGLNSTKTQQNWQKFMSEHDITPQDIRGILLTHFHPDHVGCAAWLQNVSDAPVYISPEDALIVKKLAQPDQLHNQDISHLFYENGVPHGLVDRILQMDGSLGRPLESSLKLSIIRANDEIELGDFVYRAIWTPGHSDGHFCFHNSEQGILFSGDHLLPDITSNIGYWPGSHLNPLDRYFDSLNLIKELKCQHVLPAHGEPFHDAPSRVSQLKHHHLERLKKMAVLAQGKTAYDVCCNIFGESLSLHDIRLAMAETLAHLFYLTQEGQINRVKDGEVYRYFHFENART